MSDSITCNECGMTSHNPHDVKYGYCSNCHAYTGDLGLVGQMFDRPAVVSVGKSWTSRALRRIRGGKA